MQDLFLKAKNNKSKKLPFVIYVKPGSKTAQGFFQKSEMLFEINDFTEEGFVFVPFHSGKKFLIPVTESEIISAKIESKPFIQNKKIIFDENEEEKNSFKNLVAEAIQEIEKKQLKKVVVSRKENIPIDKEVSFIEVFFRLVYLYPSAFKYCFYHPEAGMWFGATPEQFLKINENTLHTVGLAGTQLFKEGIIAWEQKEKEEQQFVTDFIKDNLYQCGLQVNVSEPYTHRAGNIVHLKTDVSAEINNNQDLNEIIRKLHPTPAVCGMPKEKSKAFILAKEGYNREYYSGFLGELNFKSEDTKGSDLFVNLRCMKMEEKQVSLYMGCGITIDSNPEKEFQETVNKSVTIKNVL